MSSTTAVAATAVAATSVATVVPTTIDVVYASGQKMADEVVIFMGGKITAGMPLSEICEKLKPLANETTRYLQLMFHSELGSQAAQQKEKIDSLRSDDPTSVASESFSAVYQAEVEKLKQIQGSLQRLSFVESDHKSTISQDKDGNLIASYNVEFIGFLLPYFAKTTMAQNLAHHAIFLNNMEHETMRTFLKFYNSLCLLNQGVSVLGLQEVSVADVLLLRKYLSGSNFWFVEPSTYQQIEDPKLHFISPDHAERNIVIEQSGKAPLDGSVLMIVSSNAFSCAVSGSESLLLCNVGWTKKQIQFFRDPHGKMFCNTHVEFSPLTSLNSENLEEFTRRGLGKTIDTWFKLYNDFDYPKTAVSYLSGDFNCDEQVIMDSWNKYVRLSEIQGYTLEIIQKNSEEKTHSNQFAQMINFDHVLCLTKN